MRVSATAVCTAGTGNLPAAAAVTTSPPVVVVAGKPMLEAWACTFWKAVMVMVRVLVVTPSAEPPPVANICEVVVGPEGMLPVLVG